MGWRSAWRICVIAKHRRVVPAHAALLHIPALWKGQFRLFISIPGFDRNANALRVHRFPPWG